MDGPGAEKFLDELIVWRELAHNLCFHRHREVESLAVLPEWAQQTLTDHASDPRDVLSWETLARGTTGDRLWDLCQASLVRHGELHNNVRMTWGKAIVAWAGSTERALELLLDLNHRYALDGADPNSYGGLLWCLGLFDRPFTPPRPPLGTVRSRPTDSHAERFDMERYAAKVLRPASGRPLEVAVVGAGLSELEGENDRRRRRKHGELDLGLPELGLLTGEDEIAHHGQFATAAERVAIDSRNHRLWQTAQPSNYA